MLRDDGGGVHQPGDHADIRPTLRRVVEDVVELRLARDQVLDHRLARFAEIFRDAVEELGVADLVLHLGGEGEFALQRRGAQQPLALRQDAHQLAIRVHLDELQHRLAVVVRHPVARFDLAAARDVRIEGIQSFLFSHIAFPP